jgi:hypothetical protein
VTTTELLDRAADLARASRRVAIVAADARQREVFRRGMQRRLEGLGRPWEVTFLIPGAMTTGLRLDDVLLAPDLDAKATEWVSTSVLTRTVPPTRPPTETHTP